MVMCYPRIDNPVFIGKTVHLAPESQKLFAEQVLRSASLVACSFCPWTKGTYVEAEHKRVQPKDGDPATLLTCQGSEVPELKYDPQNPVYNNPINPTIYFHA